MPGAPLIALFLSVACLQSANGLFVVLLGLRMVDADFPTTVTGLIMSAYFLGLMIGSLICRNIIQIVGRVRAFAAFASIISVCALAHALWVAPVPWGILRVFDRGVHGRRLHGRRKLAQWVGGKSTPRPDDGGLHAMQLRHGLGQQLKPGRAKLVYSAVASMLFALALIPLALAPGNRRSLPKTRCRWALANLATWRDRRDRRGLVSSSFFSMTRCLAMAWA